jgi:signal transduction histidine kinase
VIKHKKAENKLKEYDRLKSEFITNISHELRTPLTIFKNVISNALAGSMGPISPNLCENLKVADEAAERLAGIISNFVGISEIETGNLELNLTRFDLQPVITEALNSLSALIAEKNIKPKFHSSVHELLINADRERILQVLTELINNAIKFTAKDGHIDISAQEMGNKACIQIRDNGPGIGDGEIGKIFDHFVQMNKMVGAGRHGTGLGLSIAKELIEMHGGRIEVQSEPGNGTLVTVFLPLSPQYVPEPEAAKA